MIAQQTIRQFLAARKRKLVFLAVGCWLGGVVSMIVGAEMEGLPWVGGLFGVFFLGFAAAILGIVFLLQCPRCKGLLGSNNAPLLRDWSMFARRINFCPYCGVSLDEPYENHGTSRHAGPLA